MKKSLYALGLVSILSVTSLQVSAQESSSSLSQYVDAKGNISLPENFRTEMVHLGSWLVPDGGASGFHDVYTNKASAKAYQETGKFPDGAVLIKEIRASSSGNYTTGKNVLFASDKVKQIFVMIKDSKNRFATKDAKAETQHWGNGWGWALFKDGKAENQSVNYKKDCLGCHVPAKQHDWIYVEGYPTLKKQ